MCVYFIDVVAYCFVLAVALNGIKKSLASPDKSKRRTTTSLKVNAPPNQNSLKDYSLQQINDTDNRRLSFNCTETIKQGTVGGGGGGGGELGGIILNLSL